ncbi:MAG: hypothetical protein RUMPE_00664 [Eubacteriales bacterium SKADARSKE-1]|nr:hypothetical protein [Eubacteriales bacterium SKADARSKE-1]
MSLIPCDDDCLYQKEGYCMLEVPSIITNHTKKGCAHYIKLENNTNEKQYSIDKEPKEFF